MIQPLVALFKSFSFWRNVAIVPAIKGRAELTDKLKCCPQRIFGALHRVARPVQGAIVYRCGSKGIRAAAFKGVPIGYGKAQMLFHGLFAHLLLRIIVLEGKRIFESGPSYFTFFMLLKNSAIGLSLPIEFVDFGAVKLDNFYR